MAELLSRQYNQAMFFDERHYQITETQLYALREIFLRYDVCDQFGIFFLHRHHELLPDEIMVHSYPSPDEDLCQAHKAGHAETFPSSFSLNAEMRFVPFEFRRIPLPTPDANFLATLADHLQAHQLHRIFGLSCIAHNSGTWVENVVVGGTRAVRVLDSATTHGVTTEWGFMKDESQPIVELRKCVGTPAGPHRVD